MARRHGPSFAAREAFRSVFTGATIRALAGIRDLGEIAIAKVRGFEGADPIDVQDSDDHDLHDVWVDVKETLTELPRTVVLFFAGNTLFALPEEGDDVFTVRAQDVDVPGGPLGLFGFGGLAGLPSWIREKVGLWNKRTVRVESSENDVEIQCADGDGKKVVVVAGTTTLTLNRNGDAQVELSESGKKIRFVAGSTVVELTKDGVVTIDAGSNNVNIKGGNVILKEGSAPVAKEGSRTAGHPHSLTGSAGPYPLSGTAVTNTDAIGPGEGSANVKVP